MIHVKVIDNNAYELASVRIERVETRHDDEMDTEVADYSVQFGVDTGDGFALYQRLITGFPRKNLNTLALLSLALQNLEEKELTLVGDPDQPRPSSDAGPPRHLAREIGRALFES